MTIKVLETTEGCMPKIIAKGDWIDLYTAEEVTLKAPYARTLHAVYKEDTPVKVRDVEFNSILISLGVAMKLPEGYEAVVVPRSSTFNHWGLLQTNSQGVIDSSYYGNHDVWRMPVIATEEATIPKGTRLCQFRIQLSQKATIWQKIKWLFSKGIKLEKVNSLSDNNRGGFGTSGK